MSRLTENVIDRFSIDYLRNQVLKNAYGNDDTVIAKLDPRTLIFWYLFFGLIPWFLDNIILLIGLFIFVVITTKMARIAPLVLFLFCLGVFSQTGYLFIISLFFGGDFTIIMPLLIMTLKIAIVSLASVTAFSGLDPDKLANGLLYFGCPEQLSFSISFSYRILPIMMEEFQNILLSYRLRGKAPNKEGITGKVSYIIYQIRIIIVSFYPLMLNTAKRSRTTVEALELKGYRYSISNPKVRKIKLSMLKFNKGDAIFIIASVGYLVLNTILAANIIL